MVGRVGPDEIERLVRVLHNAEGIPASNGCAISADAVLYEVVDDASSAADGAELSRLASLLPSGAGLRRGGVPDSRLPDAPSHMYMHPICFPRAMRADVMASVRKADSLRCFASFGMPIELRLLDRTGFSLMCTARAETDAPSTEGALTWCGAVRAVGASAPARAK